MENVLELLKGCGLITPAQIRKVAICNPRVFFFQSRKKPKGEAQLPEDIHQERGRR